MVQHDPSPFLVKSERLVRSSDTFRFGSGAPLEFITRGLKSGNSKKKNQKTHQEHGGHIRFTLKAPLGPPQFSAARFRVGSSGNALKCSIAA
jgi:hypothetical protein